MPFYSGAVGQVNAAVKAAEMVVKTMGKKVPSRGTAAAFVQTEMDQNICATYTIWGLLRVFYGDVWGLCFIGFTMFTAFF